MLACGVDIMQSLVIELIRAVIAQQTPGYKAPTMIDAIYRASVFASYRQNYVVRSEIGSICRKETMGAK